MFHYIKRFSRETVSRLEEWKRGFKMHYVFLKTDDDETDTYIRCSSFSELGRFLITKCKIFHFLYYSLIILLLFCYKELVF